jgi:opacity protein-like surface antigen
MLAALCLGDGAARAQVGPMSYWTPGWPVGFDNDLADGQSLSTYGNFPGFDGSAGIDHSSLTRYKFPNGWFVGSERRSLGLNAAGINQGAGFGNFGSLYTEGVRFGYSFKGANGLPVTLFGGFENLKYNTGLGSLSSPFDSMTGTLPGYSAHAGIEFQPASNVSLSLGFGYTQQSGGRVDSDINSSLLPGATPFAFGGRR